MNKNIMIGLGTALLLTLAACGTTTATQLSTSQTATTTAATTVSTSTGASLLDTSSLFTERDLSESYDESTATKLTLNNKTVTITEEGTYILTGEISDGQIIIDVADTSKVQLVLAGVTINSSNSAAIYVKSSDKVFITTAAGTTNTLSTSGEYTTDGTTNVDGVIFSKSDLTLNGTGTLTVNSTTGHGIVAKDDLVIAGGTYTIAAAKKGISANDSLAVSTGDITITSGADAIQVENTEDSAKGYIYIADGTFTIQAEGDAISASGVVQVDGGEFNLTTGEGSARVALQTDAMDGGFPGTQTTTTTAETNTSQKGLKTDSQLLINGGTFTIDTVDDSIHSNSDIHITGGTFNLSTGDDGIHSDTNLTIDNGIFTIPYCEEGIEGATITINGGTFNITSADDGLNASTGSSSSETTQAGSGQGGGNPFDTEEGADITINGGDFTIVSDGDCIDSNNTLTINGGTLNLTCNGNGNTALDSSGTLTINGGDVTTNDGSENGESQMQGGPGRGQGEQRGPGSQGAIPPQG